MFISTPRLGPAMPRKSETSPWTLMRAARPWYLSVPIPSEIGDVIGIPKRKLEGMPRHTRLVFFIDCGPFVLRIASLISSMQLYEEETRAGRVVDTAQVATNNHFYIPTSVQAHLGLKTYPSAKIPKMLDTDDVIAWVIPREDYVRYRDVTRGGADYDVGVGNAGVGRCYIANSDRLQSILLRSPEELEKPPQVRAPIMSRGAR